MKILNIWDWKYKIFLSDLVLEKVIDFTRYLNSEEKNIYKALIDFYSSFYSFDALLDIMLKEKKNAGKYLKISRLNINKAIEIPILLEDYYKQKIKKCFQNDKDIELELMKLLAMIIDKSNYCMQTKDIQKVIFGKHYNKIEKTILENDAIIDKNMGNKSIEIKDAKSYVNKLIADLNKNKKITTDFGDYTPSEYDICVIKGVGFAEWWDRDLINSDKDKLVLYDNKDLLKKNDFEYTVYHEVYPGHGLFYNFVRANKTTIPNFDHGAMSLVEGWATFAEWNVKESQYTKILRNRAREFLSLSIFEKIDNKERIKRIYNNKIKSGYTKEQAINSVLYFTQYPGFMESYYMGAICIEEMLNNKIFHKPIDFLNSLKNKTWGELFALWG